jgi:WD40 repeat protein
MSWSVFISYAQEDKNTAERLYAALIEAGCRAFWDKRCISPGANWTTSIDQAIEQAPVMVVLLSRESIKSTHVKGELEKAISYGSHRVIPWPIPPTPLEVRDWPSSLLPFQNLTGEAEEVAREVAKIVAKVLPEVSRFFHKEVLATIESRLNESSHDLCVLGLPGSGISTTLRELERQRSDVRILDSRAFPNHVDVEAVLPSDGVLAVIGYPRVDWLAKLRTRTSKRIRIVAGSAVAPPLMEPVLMAPLSDDNLVSMLGDGWKSWEAVARVTGRSPGAVMKLLDAVTNPAVPRLEEVQELIWGEEEITKAAWALADLEPRSRTFLATLAIRGSVSPVGRELWARLLTAAAMDKYRELNARNPLSPFLLFTNDGGVLLKPEIARAIKKTEYAEALPHLGARVVDRLASARDMKELIASAGRLGFRAVLDDARTIALTQVSPSPEMESVLYVGPVPAGPLKAAEEARIKNKWRVLAHIVQLLPIWEGRPSDLQLWNQLLSAIIRSSDIDARLDGAEMLLRDLLREVHDELRYFPHWSLDWSREAIPGPLINEMLHHDPGIIPEVNAVVFGCESDHLWCADSTGFVHKWNWRSGRGSKYGIEEVQRGEVWSMAVVDGRVVISASDDGSVAVRCGARVQKYQISRGAMINAVAVASEMVVAGDDDSALHLWRLIVEDDDHPRLVNYEYIGNAESGWTLACLVVSRNEVYSGHQHGVMCRWVREASGSWIRTTIKMTDGPWVRTLCREASSGAIFAACEDGKVLRYDPTTDSVHLFAEHGASTRGMVLMSGESDVFLATGGDDGVVRLWTAAGEEVSSFGAHRGMIRALDARGSLLASSGTDGFARVWDIRPSMRPPRMTAMDVDGMVVQLVAGGTSRAFLASTGRETSLVKSPSTANPLQVSGREISTPRGKIELPSVCLGAMLSSDEGRVLASDIGGRIYFFVWSPS